MEGLERYREEHGLEPGDASHWLCRIGPLHVRLPNFEWRRRAVDAHDRHHMITGYPLTIAGEIQVAAWEWGAGRYPDWRATLMCGSLVLLGAAAMPRRTLRAYLYGRQCESFHPKAIER
ncbi:MAG TPA: hypothetical protein VI168_02220 [Croceibacterium sp.]